MRSQRFLASPTCKTFSIFSTFLVLSVLLIAAAQAQTFQVIHDFTGGPDGANPYSGLTIDSSGNLYGIASAGGGGTCILNNTPGCGTVFEMTPNSGSWTYQVLNTFKSNPDGAAPIDTVTLGSNGLFGTTAAGGEGNCSFEGDIECGTVFQLTTTQSHDRVLYRFTGGTDGAQPTANLILLNNMLYGTTLRGGDLSCTQGDGNGCGTVYQVSLTGQERVIHAFTGAGGDGVGPLRGLIADADGNLYGTTADGGVSSSCTGCGIVFELTHSSFGWREKILYTFTNTADGSSPNGGLAFDSAGNLYGMTYGGGSGGGGTVYRLHKNAQGNWTLAVLASLHPAGNAVDHLLIDSNNNVYGTAQNGGGDANDGYVFEITPVNGQWRFKYLHIFTGEGDGANPLGALVMDSAGNLYGTTLNKGAFTCGSGAGCGVVFEITQ
jgi:uncharacterized repeat protein (TIGR03803 family)